MDVVDSNSTFPIKPLKATVTILPIKSYHQVSGMEGFKSFLWISQNLLLEMLTNDIPSSMLLIVYIQTYYNGVLKPLLTGCKDVFGIIFKYSFLISFNLTNYFT